MAPDGIPSGAPNKLSSAHRTALPCWTREISNSSYHIDPETNCSEAERASRTSCTDWARQSRAGTVNSKSKSFHAGAVPVTIAL